MPEVCALHVPRTPIICGREQHVLSDVNTRAVHLIYISTDINLT